MAKGTINSIIQLGGVSMQSVIEREEEGAVIHDSRLTAGKTGSLSTRTDDDSGVVIAATGHGITISDTVAVYWSGGMRHGMRVTGVSGNDITIDLGSGDNLPAQGTAVVICAEVTINLDFDGDEMAMFAVQSSKRAHVDFEDSGSLSLWTKELTAGEAFWWAKDTGQAAPITGNPVDEVIASNGEAVESTLRIVALVSQVP